MTGFELPENEAKLLRNIRRKYKVGFDSLSVRGIDLKLLTVSDLAGVLQGKDPFENVSEFPFWVKLWESAIVLADVAVTLNPENGCRLLELGAGLGAPGLAAAARGFEVVLSDYEKLPRDFQRVSAAANNLDVDVIHLDWKDPPDMEKFDVIIGAEVLFRDDTPALLLKLFKKLLKPQGVVYFTHDQRRETLYKFLDMAKSEYKILVKKIEMPRDDGKSTIMLNCLKPF